MRSALMPVGHRVSFSRLGARLCCLLGTVSSRAAQSHFLALRRSALLPAGHRVRLFDSRVHALGSARHRVSSWRSCARLCCLVAQSLFFALMRSALLPVGHRFSPSRLCARLCCLLGLESLSPLRRSVLLPVGHRVSFSRLCARLCCLLGTESLPRAHALGSAACWAQSLFLAPMRSALLPTRLLESLSRAKAIGFAACWAQSLFLAGFSRLGVRLCCLLGIKSLSRA
jgi:hypothetical protein